MFDNQIKYYIKSTSITLEMWRNFSSTRVGSEVAAKFLESLLRGASWLKGCRIIIVKSTMFTKKNRKKICEYFSTLNEAHKRQKQMKDNSILFLCFSKQQASPDVSKNNNHAYFYILDKQSIIPEKKNADISKTSVERLWMNKWTRIRVGNVFESSFQQQDIKLNEYSAQPRPKCSRIIWLRDFL